MPFYRANKGGVSGFNYKTWLASASISPIGYNSLNDVLSDEIAIRKLMTIHASVDYLASFNMSDNSVITILTNNYCAKWINLRDYALDTLENVYGTLMDSIDKYGYGEWALIDGTWQPKGNVPVMTSNTAPYGESSASSEYNSNFQAWKAFDGNVTDRWGTSDYIKNAYIQYKFSNPVCVRKIKYQQQAQDQTDISVDCSAKIQGSDDGINWTDIETINLSAENNYYIVDEKINNNLYYIYYRFQFIGHNLENSSSIPYCNLAFLQFYGRELRVSVPTMTSNTAPWGEVFRGGEAGSRGANAPYLAFDGDDTTVGMAYYNLSSATWLGYQFQKPVCIKKVRLVNLSVSSGAYRAKNIIVQASNDNISYLDLAEYLMPQTNEPQYIELNNDNAYLYYRIKFLDTYGTSATARGLGALQFYGLDYSEYDWDEDNPRHYLYDHGVEPNEKLTVSNNNTNALAEKRNYELLIKKNANSQTIAQIYSQQMDMSGYDLLRAEIGDEYLSPSNTNVLLVGIYTSVPATTSNYYNSYVAKIDLNTISDAPNNMNLDVSSVSDNEYIGLVAANQSGEQVGYFTIKSLWFE